jgi:hypothetical protein
MPNNHYEGAPAGVAPSDYSPGPAAVAVGTSTRDHIGELAGKLIAFMETGELPDGTFTPDVFCDFTMPQWRLQAQGSADVVALRLAGHPGPGQIPRSRLDATETGFVIEVEERWEDDGGVWYCRELLRADVADGAICELSVYCTGDWDADLVARHAKTVHLIRP